MKGRALITGIAGLAAVIGGIMYGAAPGFRPAVEARLNEWMGWTEEARQADPVGFATHVEGRLEEDQGRLQSTRRQLAGEVGSLCREIREQQARIEHADALAAEFRDTYQVALTNGSFPVEVRGAGYSEEQVVSQVSSLLAEAEGHRESLGKLQQVRQKAEAKLEALTVRIDKTQAELAAISTQRELLRAGQLTDEGQRLAAQVDGLLEENREVIQDNPVRDVAALLAAEQPAKQQRPSLAAAKRFLAARSVVEFAEPTAVSDAPATVQQAKRQQKPNRRSQKHKPIFQQS